MPEIVPVSGPSSPRDDKYETQSQARIADWGRLDCDDYYYPTDTSEWRRSYPKLPAGPQLTGEVIRHLANMAHEHGRKLTVQEFVHTYERMYGPLSETIVHAILNHFDHPDAHRARREWVGRRRARTLANWMKEEAHNGFPVPLVRENPQLFNRLNGKVIPQTGNAEIDHIISYDDIEDDTRYRTMIASERRRAEQRHARRTMVTSEVRHEVQEKLTLKDQVTALVQDMRSVKAQLSDKRKDRDS